MTLIVPDGKGFSIGRSTLPGDGAMSKTLDEMIKDRRKIQIKETRAPTKKVELSTSTRSVSTNRAKRTAALQARRGLSSEKTTTKMQIDQEVKRQAKRVAKKKVTSGLAKATKPVQKKKHKDDKSPTTFVSARVPSKKAIEAAVKGMKAAGFSVPAGHQVVMTFIPSGPSGPSEQSRNRASQGKDNKGKKTRGGAARRSK